MFVEAMPFDWVEPVAHLGAPGLLIIGISFLWRALQAERSANVAWQQESLRHSVELNQIPIAVDRLRVEVLQGQQNAIAEIRNALQRCGAK